VNCFTSEEAAAVELLKIDDKVQARQVAKLKKFKAGRDKKAVAKALERLSAAARGSENLLPHILAAV
jgi:methylmalonyl-CoA mutase N-terminal domain/subunit